MSDAELLADRYECLLTKYEALMAEHLKARRIIRQLRFATRMLIAAACRTAGEYRIPLKQASGSNPRPLTADVPTLLGTATCDAMRAVEGAEQ